MEFMKRRKRRWSDNNKHFGPFTFCSGDSSRFGIVLDSGDGDEYPGCHLRIYGFRCTLLCELPQLIQPFKIKNIASTWDAATVERIGRNWYYETHGKQFGFCFSDGGFLQVFLGPQTHDSTTTKSWCAHLPWTQWRYYRHCLYDTNGALIWVGVENRKDDRNMRAAAYKAASKAKENCPTVEFLIEDYDGERITATTKIEQREWKFGTGWFCWLSWFRKDRVSRSLDIKFSNETGREKGSYKGGTCGTSIEMLPDELHEQAFRRYCEQEHRSKSGKYKVRYVDRILATHQSS